MSKSFELPHHENKLNGTENKALGDFYVENTKGYHAEVKSGQNVVDSTENFLTFNIDGRK